MCKFHELDDAICLVCAKQFTCSVMRLMALLITCTLPLDP